MPRPPTLATAMTPFPHSIEPNATLRAAREMMAKHAVRHLPVIKSRDLIGVISHSDVMAVWAGKAGDSALDTLTVKDVYISDIYVVELDEPLENVLRTMAERHIGSAIVTRHGRLSGVFTWVDACRCFGDYLAENFPHPDDDDAA